MALSGIAVKHQLSSVLAAAEKIFKEKKIYQILWREKIREILCQVLKRRGNKGKTTKRAGERPLPGMGEVMEGLGCYINPCIKW